MLTSLLLLFVWESSVQPGDTRVIVPSEAARCAYLKGMHAWGSVWNVELALTCVKKMCILWWERLVCNSEENRRCPWSISLVLHWGCSCTMGDFQGWELVVVVDLILICVASTWGGDRLTCLQNVKIDPKEAARRHRESWCLLCW